MIIYGKFVRTTRIILDKFIESTLDVWIKCVNKQLEFLFLNNADKIHLPYFVRHVTI